MIPEHAKRKLSTFSSALDQLILLRQITTWFLIRCENLQKCTAEVYKSLKEQKLSYYRGDFSEPLKTLTIGQTIEYTANQYANETAILFHRGPSLTYVQVLEKVSQ